MSTQVFYRFCPICGTAYEQSEITIWQHSCTNCGYVLYENQNTTASAVIVRKNQVLLVKRGKDPQKGLWDFPGGFVEVQEHPSEAVVREVREELGIECQVKRLYGVYAPTAYLYQGKQQYNCDIYYLVEVSNDDFHPGDDVDSCRWFSWDDLPSDEQIAFPVQITLLHDLKQDYFASKL
jgi:mutator protein MutT